jgi:hypothetical protein
MKMRKVIVYKDMEKENIKYEGYLLELQNDIDGTYAIVELSDGSIISPDISYVKFKYPT